MSEKKVLFAGDIINRSHVEVLAQSIPTFTRTQKHSLMLCAENYLPAHIKVEQRTFKGAIDVTLTTSTQIVCAKINPRGKLSQYVLVVKV